MPKETSPPTEQSADVLKQKLATHFNIPLDDIFTLREYPTGKIAILTIRAERLEANKNELA